MTKDGWLEASEPAGLASRASRQTSQCRGRFRLGFGLALAALSGLLATPTRSAGPMPDLDDLSIERPSWIERSGPDLSRTAAVEWVAFEAATVPGWEVSWNQVTGLPHRAMPGSFDAAQAAGMVPSGLTDPSPRSGLLDRAAIERMSLRIYELLRVSYPDLPPFSDLAPLALEKRGGVWWAIYTQVLEGIPIEGARADFRYSADGRLLYFGLDLIPGPLVEQDPLLDVSEAAEAAIASLAAAGLRRTALSLYEGPAPTTTGRDDRETWVAAGPDLSSHLVYLVKGTEGPRPLEIQLAWVTRTEVSDPPARFRNYVDASTGEVLQRTNEYYYGTILGHSDAEVQPATPTDPYVNLDLQNLRLSVSGVGETFSDSEGNFSLTTPDGLPRTLTSALTGSFAHIQDVTGPEPAFSTTATPGVPVEVHWSDGNSEASERDAFYHTNVIHTWQKEVEPAFTGVDYEMNVNVNINNFCNAYWDGSSINFFWAGSGCANTAQIADVVYHEYGHGTNQFVYAPASPSGAEHEGMADYQAATITDQPLIGQGFYGPGTFLRTCDNDMQWPAPECGGEPHCVGEVIAGALWHMRENLVTRLGQTQGVALADDLFHFARYGRQPTFEGYYFDVLAVDDNNGTLVDGTPHDTDIIQAFDRHNIGPGWTLVVLHTPLRDTENTTQPYRVRAVFSSPAELIPDSLAVYYSTTAVGDLRATGPIRLAMTPTGEIREFEAFIPAQVLDTQVSYHISGAADTLGITAQSPPDAPGNQHTFVVGIDVTAPTIVHAPLFHKSAAIWPVQVAATVTDNGSLSSVLVEWKKNGVDQPAFPLDQAGESDLYRGTFSLGVVEGNLIRYRVKATDSAADPNAATAPPLGFFGFTIVHDFLEDAEHGAQDMTHSIGTSFFQDQWHISTERNHTSGGASSWKFGDTGTGTYADGSDGVLLIPEIRLGPGANLSFFHWISAEQENATLAWDGSVVEVSTDSGTSWSLLVPIGGYTHTIIENPASPFPPGYPCWSGSFDWREADFDLAALSGQTARIRFRFGSDGFVTQEGWHIDDVVLDPGQTPTDVPLSAEFPTRTALLGSSPNPFRPGTHISFAVAPGSEKILLEILDVAGRRVKTLVSGRIEPGVHEVLWNGRSDAGYDLGSGVYFARLRVDREECTHKLLRVR